MKNRNMMNETGIRPQIIQEIKELARNMEPKSDSVWLAGKGRLPEGQWYWSCSQRGNIAAFALDVEEETTTLLKYDVVNLDGSVQKELLDVIEKEGVMLYEKIWKILYGIG